jgi:hypothetical protein
VPKHFGYDPRPHRGDRFLRMRDFPTRVSYTHFEPRHLYNPHFFIVVLVPLVQMVRCKRLSRPPYVAWLSAGFLRFISLTLARDINLFSSYVGDGRRPEEHMTHGLWLLTTHDWK